MKGELRPVSILAPAPDVGGLYKPTHTGLPFADCGIRMEYVLAKIGGLSIEDHRFPFCIFYVINLVIISSLTFRLIFATYPPYSFLFDVGTCYMFVVVSPLFTSFLHSNVASAGLLIRLRNHHSL